MEEAIWFFGGAFCYQLLSKLFLYGHTVRHTFQTGLHTLRLCVVMLHDIEFMRSIKYNHLSESGVKEEQLQLIKDIDEQTINNWKRSVIIKFKQTLPASVRGVFTFRDWDGAIQMLDKHLKRGG